MKRILFIYIYICVLCIFHCLIVGGCARKHSPDKTYDHLINYDVYLSKWSEYFFHHCISPFKIAIISISTVTPLSLETQHK